MNFPSGREQAMLAIRTLGPNRPNLPIRCSVQAHPAYPDIYPDILSGYDTHLSKP